MPAPRSETLVLMVNTGSPAEPTADALKLYLSEFLGDKRVVELPKVIWWPILHGLVLPKRAEASAERYRTVWTEEGSPLVAVTRRCADALQKTLGEDYVVIWGMRYGTNRVADVLPKILKEEGFQRLVVLPMFAQYATQTTAAVYDVVDEVLKKTGWTGDVVRIESYYNHPDYIEALAENIRLHWDAQGFLTGKGRLLFSFHGIPQASVDKGSPYEKECRETARLIAERLGLRDEAWSLAFQSKFGRGEWLKPATVDVAERFAKEGILRLDVICPGFAADCLETIEEIATDLKAVYLTSGGKEFRYIPALNDGERAAKAYAAIVRGALQKAGAE